MMFIIKQKELIDKLRTVCSVVESKNINEVDKILDCVYFDVNSDGLTIIASSSDIQVKAKITGDFSSENISFCVNAKYLSESIGTLQSLLDLKFELDDNNVFVSSGKTKYKFTNLSSKENNYPVLQLKEYKPLFNINNEVFKKAFQSVAFSMGANHLRYFLAGTMLKVSDGKMVFVTTDTHRLAYYTITDENIKDIDKSIIIPKKTVNYLEKYLSSSGGSNNEINAFLADEDFFVVKNDEFEVISKLVIGAYPEYEKVFSQQHDKETIINTQNFKDAINRIAIFATDKFKTINFSFENNNLLIESKSTVNESAKTEIEIKYENEPININFNVQYISELLSRIEEKETKVIFSDQNASVVFTFVGNDNYKYVLMPLRV